MVSTFLGEKNPDHKSEGQSELLGSLELSEILNCSDFQKCFLNSQKSPCRFQPRIFVKRSSQCFNIQIFISEGFIYLQLFTSKVFRQIHKCFHLKYLYFKMLFSEACLQVPTKNLWQANFSITQSSFLVTWGKLPNQQQAPCSNLIINYLHQETDRRYKKANNVLNVAENIQHSYLTCSLPC